jgi:hypothetical protein
MKLNSLNEDEYRILQLLVREFYVALPESLKTYSLFSTHLLSKALHHYGIRTRVIPCRLWCSLLKTEKEFVGGFLNFGDAEKWNGHVVCLVGDWLVDTAIYHLNPTFGYQVPKIIAKRIVYPQPFTYTQHKINKKTEFIWYRLPVQIPTIPLVGYEDYMKYYLPTLIDHIDSLMTIPDKDVSPAEITSAEEPIEGLIEHVTESSSADESQESLENHLSEQTEQVDDLNSEKIEQDSAEINLATEAVEDVVVDTAEEPVLAN